MPQLMPLNWMLSVIMVVFLLLVIYCLYYLWDENYFILMNKSNLKSDSYWMW